MSEKIEKLLVKKAVLDQKIRVEKAKESKKMRQERTRRLIQNGGLIEIAGLGDLDKGMLLGALLEISQVIASDFERSRAWKHIGDKVLSERGKTREVKRNERNGAEEE